MIALARPPQADRAVIDNALAAFVAFAKGRCGKDPPLWQYATVRKHRDATLVASYCGENKNRMIALIRHERGVSKVLLAGLFTSDIVSTHEILASSSELCVEYSRLEDEELDGLQIELHLGDRPGRKLCNLLAEDHSDADGRGRHHITIEPYGYRWYRVGGLGY